MASSASEELGQEEGDRCLRPDHQPDAVEARRTASGLGEIEIVVEDFGAVLGTPFIGLIHICLDDAKPHAGGGEVVAREPPFAPDDAEEKRKQEDESEQARAFALGKPRPFRRENGQGAREEEHGQEAQGIHAEDSGELHRCGGRGEPVADEVPGQAGEHMAAGELGEAEGDGEGEHPRRARSPQQHGKRGRRGEEQRHAARQQRHDEGNKPTMTPRLNQEGLGDPIETGQEIAEAEPEAG